MSASELEVRPREKRPAVGADLILPLLALAFTLYFLATTFEFVWEARANGTIIGVTLIALIAIQLARIGRQVATGRATLALGEIAETSPTQSKRLALVAILAAFIATIPWLGTSLGLFLTMSASMWVLGVRSVRTLLGVALGTTVVVYLLFIVLLQSRLPRGPIENLVSTLVGGGF